MEIKNHIWGVFLKKNNIKLFAILLSIVLFLDSFIFVFLNGYSGLHLRKKPKEGQIKVACVGDSVTYGHGVFLWNKNCYPNVLQDLLGEEYNVQNFGVSGTTVQKHCKKAYTKMISYRKSINYEPDILIFMMGSNDTKPENWINGDTFKKQYLALLDTYISDENVPEIYLCTLARVFYKDENQTTGESSFHIQADIVEEINLIIKEVAMERGYKLVDIYSVTATDRSLFQIDCVHPNVEGAKAIAEEIYKNIK